jgi:hypothetical protein
MNVTSRERIGFAPAVTLLPSVERAAKDETVRIPAAPSKTSTDITPASTLPSVTGDTFTNETVKLTSFKGVRFVWEGEEMQGVNNGVGFLSLQQQQIAQALRTLTNGIETDLADLYKRASRAHGTAGTTPFGTANDLSDIAEIERILADNGAPDGDLHLVLNSAAVAKIKSIQSGLFHANEAGTDDLLRRGSIGDLEGFRVHRSAKVKSHTKGTGASYLLNDASATVDKTTIAADTGTGTIVAGDVVTFAGTTDKYIVDTALSAGSFTIGLPGLQVAETDNDAITVGANYKANMAFARSAIVLGARPPKIPAKDLAADRMLVTDPLSGITYDFAMYAGYYQTIYEVSLVWGVAVIKPAHLALLLG